MASTALAAWEDFTTELKAREEEICSQLPSNVTREKFTNAAIAAVKQNPDILQATARSVFKALTQAAQDGLLPDGREGVITSYYNKDIKGHEAKWNPMAGGIRKRARDLDDIVIDAQVVYLNDKFLWHQGDDPKIEHTPAPLGQARGEKIGAYAIIRKLTRDTKIILHREVMDFGQIEKVKSCSQAPNGLLWTKFEEEAWKKTVLRRGMKSVPVSPELETIIRRDDDQFNFDEPTTDEVTPPRASDSSPFLRKGAEASQAVTESKAEVVEQKQETAATPTETLKAKMERERAEFIKQAEAELAACQLVRDVPVLQDRVVAAGVMTVDDEREFETACAARIDAIKAAKAKK